MPVSLGRLSSRRLRLTFLALLLTGGGLLYRLYLIQIVRGEILKEIATKQRVHIYVKGGQRGYILDASGSRLTENIPTPSIFAVPGEVKDIPSTAKKLAAILNMDILEVMKQLYRRESAFRWIKRHVSQETARRIAMEKLPGIGVLEEIRRSYPKGSFAAPVIGFTSMDLKGIWGLEQSLDGLLRGKDGRVVVEATPKGMALTDQYIEDVPPKNGASVQLTIEPNIQFMAEKLADETALKFKAKQVQILAMAIPSFKILAMAQYPTFDPNHFQSYPEEAWRNLNISWTYEPGSTLKVFAVASALASGAITRETTFYDPGFLQVGKHIIRDAHGERHGVVKAKDIITVSCNVGASQIGLRMGRKTLVSYYRRFGFGQKTGIKLPGEESGIFQFQSHFSSIRLANLTFGQGITVTPLQLLAAFGALANNGKRKKPYIIDKVIYPDGRTETSKSEKGVQVVPAWVARELLSDMENVVLEGTGKNARIKGYRIAGKTGTAQKAIGGRYHPGKFVGSFIGTFPLPDPRWVVLVVVDEPEGVPYGGRVAAPAFAQMAKAILRSFGVPPSLSVSESHQDQKERGG